MRKLKKWSCLLLALLMLSALAACGKKQQPDSEISSYVCILSSRSPSWGAWIETHTVSCMHAKKSASLPLVGSVD